MHKRVLAHWCLVLSKYAPQLEPMFEGLDWSTAEPAHLHAQWHTKKKKKKENEKHDVLYTEYGVCLWIILPLCRRNRLVSPFTSRTVVVPMARNSFCP